MEGNKMCFNIVSDRDFYMYMIDTAHNDSFGCISLSSDIFMSTKKFTE